MFDIHGYTTLMSPEAASLPYLETLLSYKPICDTITICYSRFPKLNIEIPNGAFIPWENDKSLDILHKFNTEVMDGKLIIIEHTWDTTNPLEDGITKQIARTHALSQIKDKANGWVIHFDADELLNDDDVPKLFGAIQNDNQQPINQKHPFIITGILELFGNSNKVRFGFGNWLKIRATRYLKELQHGLPLRLGQMPVAGRHPVSKKLIAIDNRDDGAGFINVWSMSRPDYNSGLFLADVNLLNELSALRSNLDPMQKKMLIPKTKMGLNNDIQNGVWIYHTSWIDIKRKWSMGWFFDNFFSVLSGKQLDFESKPTNGNFTRTNNANSDEDLQKELANPFIQSIIVSEPKVFNEVKQWRISNGL